MARHFISTSARQMALVLLVSLLAQTAAQAQGRAGRGPPPTGEAAAPLDLTGYWVSLVSQDCILGMVTARRGFFFASRRRHTRCPISRTGLCFPDPCRRT